MKTLVPELDVVELTPHVLFISIYILGESFLGKAQREEIIGHVASQAASSSSGQQIDPIPVSPMVSVPAISDNSPVVSTVGRAHAKIRSRQNKQQPNKEETSDAVACQKDESRRAHDWDCFQTCNQENRLTYIKRNIVEFFCGGSSKIGQSKCQRDGCSPGLHQGMT